MRAMDRYENKTKDYLIDALKVRTTGLKSINRRIHIQNKILKSYAESIKRQKGLHRGCYFDRFKWKMLILAAREELSKLKELKETYQKHIQAIGGNLTTYDKRNNEKFGRKSPFISLDFGYDVNLKILDREESCYGN